ncbi:hypothetical protein AAV94_12175 [Lampropedia cohaerens]|uniref:MobA-like NTP transferase domain-containing protein n=2 Tax=Lampropedia cohaerens TaxID=1610491 RepID=A0A0U1PXA5_9BURK|nr:hypothetical protein AAV94_12175 [Lampropedia cohaerens]
MQAHATDVVVLVLAGGQGCRFRAAGGQGHKLDAVVAGRTLLETTLAQVAASGLPWRLVCPAHDSPSMGDTIVRGVQVTAEAAGWLILPGDMPLVQPGSLRTVARALQAKVAPVVVPSYLGQRGHPVGFAAAYRQALLCLHGAGGARSVAARAEAQGQMVVLPLQDAGVVFDVDTPEDLALAEVRLRTVGAQHQ